MNRSIYKIFDTVSNFAWFKSSWTFIFRTPPLCAYMRSIIRSRQTRTGPGDEHRAYELVYINVNATLMFAHFDDFSAFLSIHGMEYNWVCPTPETLLTEGWRLLDKALKLSQIVSSLRARRKKVDGHPTITDILGKGKFEFRIFLDSTLKYENILIHEFLFSLSLNTWDCDCLVHFVSCVG